MVTQNEDFTPEHAESEHDFAGEPDGFGRLWTPHRMAYIEADRPSRDAGDGCPFCAAPGKDDAEGLIVHRGEHCFVVLNLFPYNPGHVLVCSYRHVADLTELTDDELWELNTLTRTVVLVIRDVASPAAFNVGLNLGQAAGGSLSEHLHQHVVPRWTGDANFMPVVAHTKPLIQTLAATREDIARAWPRD